MIGEEIYSRMDIEAFLMIVRGFQPAGKEGGRERGGGKAANKLRIYNTHSPIHFLPPSLPPSLPTPPHVPQRPP